MSSHTSEDLDRLTNTLNELFAERGSTNTISYTVSGTPWGVGYDLVFSVDGEPSLTLRNVEVDTAVSILNDLISLTATA